MEYDNTNRGVLFRNDRKEPGSKKPDMTGKLDVGGKEYYLSAWYKRSQRTGDEFLSVSISEPGQYEKKPDGAPSTPVEVTQKHDAAKGQGEPFIDDEIPFVWLAPLALLGLSALSLGIA